MVFMTKKYKMILIFIIIVVFLILVAYCLIDASKKYNLTCIAVNESNGDIAIAYMLPSSTPKVTVYDANGRELFNQTISNSGRGIRKMLWDKNENLCIGLRKSDTYKILDRNGGNVELNAQEIDFPDFWYDTWNEQGSSYVKQLKNINYCYDYPNFFEHFGLSLDRVYLQKENGEIITLWTNKR